VAVKGAVSLGDFLYILDVMVMQLMVLIASYILLHELICIRSEYETLTSFHICI
jgi:hypothetical protein